METTEDISLIELCQQIKNDPCFSVSEGNSVELSFIMQGMDLSLVLDADEATTLDYLGYKRVEFSSKDGSQYDHRVISDKKL